MIGKDKLSLGANDMGNLFYNKWKNDTKCSVFIMAPACLIFLLGCFTMIVGVSLKLFFISLLPIIIIVLVLIYVPFVVRRKYLNNLVKKVVIEDDSISLKTYQWFSYKSISVSVKTAEMEVKESTSETFFKGKRVLLLKLKDVEANTFYLIEEFFDNTVSFSKLLNK